MDYRVKPEVEFLTESKIEAKAEALLKEYEEQQQPINGPPIPIEFIVTRLLGFDVMLTDIRETDTVAQIHPNNMTIYLNENKSDYLNEIGPEFTWAHEIGHWVLDHFEDCSRQLHLGISYQPARFLHRDTRNLRPTRHEFQAEYFAGCLLMPKRFLLPLAQQLNLLKWPSLYTLKDQFCVSVTAMRIRLEKLGLIYVHKGAIYRDHQEALGNRKLF